MFKDNEDIIDVMGKAVKELIPEPYFIALPVFFLCHQVKDEHQYDNENGSRNHHAESGSSLLEEVDVPVDDIRFDHADKTP